MYDYKKEHEKDMIGWIVATKDSKTKEYYSNITVMTLSLLIV